MDKRIFILVLVSLLVGLSWAEQKSTTVRFPEVSAKTDSLSPSAAEAVQLLAKGNAYHDNGMFREAIACYMRADSLNPGMSVVGYEIAYSYMMLGENDSAVVYGKKSIALSPRPDTYSLLGDIYDHLGKLDSALYYYDEGLEKFPDSYLLMYNKSVCLYVAHRSAEAYGVILNSLKYTRRHEGSYFLAGQLAYGLGYGIDFFANGSYANFIGETEARMLHFAKCFSQLVGFYDAHGDNRPSLRAHPDWLNAFMYRFSKNEAPGENLFGSGNGANSLGTEPEKYELLVRLGIYAMREAVKGAYDFELKPFFRATVENGYEEEFMRIVFRHVNRVAYDSWKMMNEKRLEAYYEKVVLPFWDGEQRLRRPILVDRPQ